MERPLDNAASQRKLFGILSALSILLISGSLANRSFCKAVPKIEVVDSLQTGAADQDATFEKVWVEYNVRIDGKRGLRIHAKFKVKNSLNVSCRLIARFYKRDGTYLEAGGPSTYRTAEGHVYTFVDIKPSFKSTEYADKTLFIPYEAFNLRQRGLYLLKFVLFVDRNAQGGSQTIGHSADFNFKYSKDTQ